MSPRQQKTAMRPSAAFALCKAAPHASLYIGGAMYDLNALTGGLNGTTLTTVLDVSDIGTIYGRPSRRTVRSGCSCSPPSPPFPNPVRSSCLRAHSARAASPCAPLNRKAVKLPGA